MKKAELISDIEKCQKKNQKIIVLYNMLSSDLIFYYAISYLFLINIKGLTTAQIVFADSFYPLFKLLFQVPCTILIQKIGKRNSIIIGNSCIAIYLLLIIGLINTASLIIANIFIAIGFVLKGMADSNLLYDSLEESPTKRELFSKYQGKSIAGYYFIEAVTAVITGFLYVINPYLPLSLSFIVIMITVFLSFNLCDIPNIENTTEKSQNALEQFKSYISDLKTGFGFILKSPRLRSLIIYSAVFSSLLNLMVTLRRSLLNDVNVSSENFGIIFAVMGIIACISSFGSLSLHKKYRNRTLSVLGILLTTSTIACGAIVILNFPKFLLYYLLLIMFAIQYSIKGPYYTLIKQYLNSFSNTDMRLKIYSANALIEYVVSTILSLISSLILAYYSNATTTLILGIGSFVLMLFLIKYMSTRVGLKPEEYTEKDIGYENIN